jgi:hypothetical protein
MALRLMMIVEGPAVVLMELQPKVMVQLIGRPELRIGKSVLLCETHGGRVDEQRGIRRENGVGSIVANTHHNHRTVPMIVHEPSIRGDGAVVYELL